LFRKGGSAVAIDPLVRPLAGTLNENEERALAQLVASELFNGWGGSEGGDRRSSLHEFELSRLALLARRGDILFHTAQYAVRWLEGRFAYREAAELGEAAIVCIEQAGHAVPLGLRRATAENDQTVGEVQRALTHLEGALQEIGRMKQEGRPVDHQDYGGMLVAHARLLKEVGRPDDALLELQQARGWFKAERDQAVTLGEIARLLSAKGEVDQALKLHQEGLAIFEALGDKRSRAITLGDIAQLLSAKGEVDQALKLHQEGLAIFEALGEKRLRAVTLGDIARLLSDKGEVDRALKLHQEELAIYEGLGDKRSRAVALGDIARLLSAKGEVDQALKLHQEQLAIYEALGEKRLRAVTLGDIARLLYDKGEVDQALKLHQEQLAIAEALGDLDGVANTLWSIAQIELHEQHFQQAFERLADSYAIILKLGRLDGICYVGLDFGRLLWAAGRREEGLAVLERSRDGFAKLGRSENTRYVQSIISEIQSK